MRWLQLRHSAMAGLLAVTSLAVANGAMAASTVTFGSLGGSQGDDFSAYNGTGTYSEAGFNVDYYAGSVLVGQNFNSNPFQSLYGTGTGSIVVTNSTGLFSFDSIDLIGNNGIITYTFVGKTGGMGGSTVFTVSNPLAGGTSFNTVPSGNASLIDTLLVSVTPSGTSFNLDNISVSSASVVPVPAAAWLFGSGLLGLAGFLRKRG